MALKLYAHPFSSYSQKALIALYENDTPFEYRKLGEAEADAELAALWPMKRFPVLVDDGHAVLESTIIIEHLQRFHAGPVALIPDEPRAALDVRMMDRFFDHYVMTPVQKIVGNALRAEADRDAFGVSEARAMLDTSYAWLDGVMARREWASGAAFSLADCAAAPSLFYADWTHEIAPKFANVIAYRQRLLARPSYVRCVDEARYFRPYFPLGAPDRD